MTTHTVTITYTGSPALTVDPPTVQVQPGDAIQFPRGEAPGVPRRGKFRLTFIEKEFFHTDDVKFPEHGHFDEDGGLVHVGALTHLTNYECHLFEGTVEIASSGVGGAVDPVHTIKAP